MGWGVLRVRDHTFSNTLSMSRMNYWLDHFKTQAFSVPPTFLEFVNRAVTFKEKWCVIFVNIDPENLNTKINS